jgi:stage IV sporulation protein FB
MTWGRVHITAGFALLWAAMIWLDPALPFWVWLAAGFHELGHWLALKCYGGKVSRWVFSCVGVTMVLGGPALSYGAEVMVSLAGPALSLLAAAVAASLATGCGWQDGYILAGANLVLGLFNLLPAPALDGGVALRQLLCWRFSAETADRASRVLGVVTGAGVAGVGLYIFVRSGYNVTLLLIGVYLLLTAIGGNYVRKIGTAAAVRPQTGTLHRR